jgi:hypothetical protein
VAQMLAQVFADFDDTFLIHNLVGLYPSTKQAIPVKSRFSSLPYSYSYG